MPRSTKALKLLLFVALVALPASGQQADEPRAADQQAEEAHAGHGEKAHNQLQMPGMEMDETNPAADFLMSRASGTSADPASAPMHMVDVPIAGWDLMFHGIAFISDIQQTGPRGGDKFVSTNWFMGMAQHSVGKGSFVIRAMLSLDPATVTERRFPELFQTGETAFGSPIVDGQHPHDFFMELSVHYARPLGEKTIFDLYFAPVGDPALGPVGFPHRVTASELPQAPLSHHLQDSSHIVNEVLTAGITRHFFRIEASGFHGQEPDESRWNIDHGAIDSWSTRLWITPTENWAGQVSVGRLTHPEAGEPGDIVRSTASVTYNLPLTAGDWATSVIWGRNHKIAQQRNINSYALESMVHFREKNFVTGRVELVDKDELFDNDPALKASLAQTAGSVFRIGAYTLGYTRDFELIPRLETGLGGNFTVYTLPGAIKPFYGDHPAAFYIFARVRLKHADSMHHHAH